ncbi:MAG: SRPBCC family protein [Porphyrobacter sp.]|nr:SRPBCC family protein [Porphyrobacter sp.]
MTLSSAARAVLLGLGIVAAAPASADITRTTDSSFVSRNEVVVSASPKDVWLALINPAAWWQSEHTWSGNAKNLSLTPQAGGCFCETIPEVDEPGRFTLQGSVEHMRVVQAYPEAALRMVGNLGPLQSEPVTGVLTIAISKVPKGTRIVFEYNVGGPMRYEVPVISKAVDGVMAAQIASLAKPLGVVPMPPPPAAVPPASADPAPAASAATGQGGAKPVAGPPAAAVPPAGTGGIKPAAAPIIKPAPLPAVPPAAPAAKPAPQPAPKPAPKPSSVEDAFSDLGDKPKA